VGGQRSTAAGYAGKVAVVAHQGKSLGGGLPELRSLLAEHDVHDPLWYEVPKSRKAPKRVREALDAGAELIFVWGGDGMVQRSVDALAGSGVTVALIPAGTANLLASSLGIKRDLAEAVRIGLHGQGRTLDLGVLNGEHFAVMAGVGLDAKMIRDADGGLKDRLGRLAYVWTALKHIGDGTVHAKIKVDGERWFDGPAGCVLLGNIGTVMGGIAAFDDARPDDGWLDVGVATADGALEWARTVGQMAVGRTDRSPFVEITRGRRVTIKLAEPVTYELDGGDRKRAARLKARIIPAAVTIRVPA
jgi:diacylglycerol kinase (ATP)